MKKILSFVIALFVTVHFNFYFSVGRVVEYNAVSDSVLIETEDGNIWQYDGIKGTADDICYMIFNNNGTADVHDDEIIYINTEVK